LVPALALALAISLSTALTNYGGNLQNGDFLNQQKNLNVIAKIFGIKLIMHINKK
jgi:hypothetical protein